MRLRDHGYEGVVITIGNHIKESPLILKKLQVGVFVFVCACVLCACARARACVCAYVCVCVQSFIYY